MLFFKVLATIRANSRRHSYVHENEEVLPQGNQVLIQVHNAPQVGNDSREEFRTFMNLLSHALTAKANNYVVAVPIRGMCT